MAAAYVHSAVIEHRKFGAPRKFLRFPGRTPNDHRLRASIEARAVKVRP